jgi:hypothetical protein
MASDILAMEKSSDISASIADIGFRIGNFAYPATLLFFLFFGAFRFFVYKRIGICYKLIKSKALL